MILVDFHNNQYFFKLCKKESNFITKFKLLLSLIKSMSNIMFLKYQYNFRINNFKY